MAIDLNTVIKGAANMPPRMIVHGVQGIGKTTLAASAPNPIFIQTEDGMGVLDAPRFPLAECYEDVHEALTSLASEEHNYKTLVIDSLDWLEPLIWSKLCRDQGYGTIEEPGYGKGYNQALDIWGDFIQALNYLRSKKDMTVILLAHTQVNKYNDPSSEPYDRYTINLHRNAAAKMLEFADAVLFANYRTTVTTTDAGFGQKKSRALGSGERIIFTEERPSHIAKNRYALPAELPLDWSRLASLIPYLSTTPTNLQEIA